MTDLIPVHELEERLAHVRRDLPLDLIPMVERHHQNLLGLVQALEAAGRPPETIRQTVQNLLQSYEKDLLSVFEAKSGDSK
ncbi:hypothetical protein [Paracoccus laeviglucosivorans]|uniref:Uncharacterized protein n=1 Tax=Paracoccus laeviglucosivorans TaxID=1197861 RepID=A0A521BJR7_9RHOB|nr:hypothetical protein [Paracoccus laeviglucosivorans]SMO47384.1 hypothetical protein SAMN06265221_102335 [Paracoccus laeviglucosivorans]